MKFGKLSFDTFVKDQSRFGFTDEVTVNIGDAAQMFAINKLYEKMGIPEDELVEIGIHELSTYQGEYLIVPINWLVARKPNNVEFFSMSPYIIPVFLGLSLTNLDLSSRNIDFLKRFQPIGSRDERTMRYLRSCGVDSYVGGCLAATIDCEETEDARGDKYFFIDVPSGIKDFIPEDIKPHIQFCEQELFCKLDDIPGEKKAEEWVWEVIKTYKREAKVIVTSRFHGAVISLALGIPVIVVLENETYRFSWIKNFCNIYTPETYKDINWDPKVDNRFEYIKKNIQEIAIERLKIAHSKYYPICHLSESLENPNFAEENETLYYDTAIKFIQRRWGKNEAFDYCFWGPNKNAEKIYDFLQNNYPNAHLACVYDMYNNRVFHGIDSINPVEKGFVRNAFVFVTSYIASMEAPMILKKSRIGSDMVFLCKREFLREI